jgi:hypothetical protein
VIRANPQDDSAYYRRGRAWAQEGNPEQAAADWRKAIELDWRNALEVHYARRLLKSPNAELDRLIEDAAIAHLEDLGIVSGYAVGYSGSPGEFYTVSLIISRPFDEKRFLPMVQSSNPVIRAMAILCLARENKSKYEKVIQSFYTDTAEVGYVAAGCGISRITLDKLVRNITEDPNFIDYWSPSHTEWKLNTANRDSREQNWIRQRIEAIQSLLAKGADVNVKDQYGDTPLHYAAQHGKADMCKLLIAHGSNINDKNRNSETPLHYATLWGNTKAVELLLEHGAAVNKKTSQGQTPLQIAIQMNYQGLADLLGRYEAER